MTSFWSPERAIIVEEQLNFAIVKVGWFSYAARLRLVEGGSVDVLVSRRSRWVHFVPTIRHPPGAVVNDVPPCTAILVVIRFTRADSRDMRSIKRNCQVRLSLTAQHIMIYLLRLRVADGGTQSRVSVQVLGHQQSNRNNSEQ